MKKSSILNEVFDLIKIFITSFIAVYLFTTFLFKPIKVQGNSMYPNLIDGEFGISNVIGKTLNGIKRFDIVIVYIKEQNEYLVKRVIGLPGDIISFNNDILYVNNEVVDEYYLNMDYKNQYSETGFTSNIEGYIVPENSYFCLGDNRPFSKDSRFYGSFSDEQIVCKGIVTLYPFDLFGKVAR